MLKKNQKIFILFLITISCLFILSRFISVKSQALKEQPTTANVTISGFLGNIMVQFYPVTFVSAINQPGVQPATTLETNPKRNEGSVGFIRVNTTTQTNVAWNISMNATDLVDSFGHIIPVSNIYVNSTCNGTKAYMAPLALSKGLQFICGGLGTDFIQKYNSADIYFWLSVPAGQFNSTYNGTFWILLNSTFAYNNRVFPNASAGDSMNNINTTVKKYVEFSWDFVPINFGTMNPGTSSNATAKQGSPANLTNGAATNIPIDFYINGTDLNSGSDIIKSDNITYSNASTDNITLEWPFRVTHILNNSLPSGPIGGDFVNWGLVKNNTNILSFWNITIKPGQPGGVYSGNIYAKAVDSGTKP